MRVKAENRMVTTDIANINNLTKEEQETIHEVLEGTINHKNIEK